MANIPRPKLNKIPGGGMPLAKKESYAKDLNKMTWLELLEIKEREEKLLKNRSKMQKLPDKGKRIQDFYDKVVKEMERRSNVEEAAKIFSNLNIASQGEKRLNELEWQGKIKKLYDDSDPLEDVLDSDDETDVDPLKVIAQRQMHERKVKVEQPEVNLITNSDIQEIESFKSDYLPTDVSTLCGTSTGISSLDPKADCPGAPQKAEIVCETANSNDENIVSIGITGKLSKHIEPKEGDTIETEAANFINAKMDAIGLLKKENISNPTLNNLMYSLNCINSESSNSSSSSHTLDLEPHVHYLVDKTETKVQQPAREKFKPFRTTVSNVHDPIKERQRKKNKHWEITAATPPPMQHNEAQLLSLMDSVEIQTQYITKLKELQEKQATERLAARLKRLENRKIELPSEEDLRTKTSFTKYRNTQHQLNNIEGERKFNDDDDEVHDPLDEEKFGGVNYTVYE